MDSIAASAGRAVSRLTAALALLALLLAVPAGLAWAIGWPLPTSVPTSWAGWQQLLTSPIPDTAILRLLATAGWLLWAAFARAVWVETKAVRRGIRMAHHRSPGLHPLRALAAFLIATIAAGSIATTVAARPASATASAAAPGPAAAVAATVQAASAASAAASPGDVAPGVAAQAMARAPLLPAGPAVLVVNGCSHLHTVIKGESLWAIAEQCLGDGARWPEIWHLNQGRFWPAVSGYQRFTDPDLIYPRWTLRLPAGAVAPPDIPPVEPVEPTPTHPADPSTTVTTPPTTGPATSGPTASAAPSTAPPTTPPAAVAPATTTPPPAGTATTHPAPTHPAPTPSAPNGPAIDDDQGVSLPDGSWVPWALAAAISAAAAMVWLQRRRRFIPGSGEPLTDLPAPVRHLDRAVRRNPETPVPASDVEHAAAVPAQQIPPPGGVGLVGDGAAAAARAAIVAMLTAGGPDHPPDRAEVVIDADALATLVGSDAVQLAEWPRLHIADDLDAALLHVETEIVRRGRILSFHAAPTVAALRSQVPDEEPLPPVLFVGEAPTTAASNRRMRVTAGLGERLNVTVLLLGQWAGGPTLHVALDGHTRAVGDPAGEQPLPDRIGVLEPQAAAQMLLTVREAHTGRPPTTPQPPIPLAAPPPGQPTEAASIEPAAATPPVPAPPHPSAGDREEAGPVKARLRVLGTANINGLTPPEQGLRGKALELAVYLACHTDGASTRDIGEHIAGDYKIQQADAQVHQNLSNLRKTFARLAGPRDDGYILTLPGATTRYRLNPDNVDVDLWTLRDLLREATLASGERRRDLLATACDLYTAPLAEGCKYDWITPHRETARRWGTEAHQLHAETLLDTDPQAAADILDKAIRLDKHNEQLYVRALHARHALRDADGLRIVMRALTKAMADVDAEPSEETTTLYHRLATGLDQR